MPNTSPSSPSSSAQPLSGKVAIVTGSSRGIGRATALRLAADGARVMLTGRDVGLLGQVVEEVRRQGGAAEFCALDLREPGAAAKLVAETIQRLGAIDILVNNAGATKRGDFLALTDDDWADGFALKFHGAVRLARAAWPFLKARGGSVVNIAGVGGRTPGAEFTIGGSVNAAMLSLTKALADLGVIDGVQVNVVNPGFVRTDRLAKRLEAMARAKNLTLEAAAESIVAESAVVRLGEPEDIANLVAFLVAPSSRFLHGSVIDIDGGQTKTL